MQNHSNDVPVAKIGYAVMNGGRRPSDQKTYRQQPKKQPIIVRVFNGKDNLVDTISKHVLVRFSGTASKTLPKYPNANQTAPLNQAAQANNYLELILDFKVDLEFLPSDHSVKRALSWVRHNCVIPDVRRSTPYPLEDLNSLGLDRQLDAYRVAVALDLKAFPHYHLRQLLISAIPKRPTLEQFTWYYNRLNVSDPVMTQVCFAHNKAWYDHGLYTQAEQEAFNTYFQLSKNRDLQSKMEWVGRTRVRQKREEREQLSTAGKSAPNKANVGPTSKPAPSSSVHASPATRMTTLPVSDVSSAGATSSVYQSQQRVPANAHVGSEKQAESGGRWKTQKGRGNGRNRGRGRWGGVEVAIDRERGS